MSIVERYRQRREIRRTASEIVRRGGVEKFSTTTPSVEKPVEKTTATTETEIIRETKPEKPRARRTKRNDRIYRRVSANPFLMVGTIVAVGAAAVLGADACMKDRQVERLKESLDNATTTLGGAVTTSTAVEVETTTTAVPTTEGVTTTTTDAVSTTTTVENAAIVSVESLREAASTWGQDNWTRNFENWIPVDNNGWAYDPEPNGLNTVIGTDGAVLQGYVDAMVHGSNPAIALVLGPGLEMPMRGATLYVLNGEQKDQAVKRAFEGALELEKQSQPNVYVAQVCHTEKAIPGYKVTENAPAWEAKKITAEEAATLYGKDDYSMNPANWRAVDNGYGMELKPREDGSYSVIYTADGVGQAYWDAKVEGEFQAIALTIMPDVEIPVRGVTIYNGIPKGMENEVSLYAFKQALELEAETQPGVYVALVCKAEKAKPNNKTTATTVFDSLVANHDWSNLNGLNAKDLPDGGKKIGPGNKQPIMVDADEKIIYWNGTETVWKNGPAVIVAGEATVYPIN